MVASLGDPARLCSYIDGIINTSTSLTRGISEFNGFAN